MEEELKSLGLSGKEAKIYVELLKIEQIDAYALSKRVGVERTVTYNTLNKLVEKGLVSHVISGGKKQFKCASPENLLRPLQDKENIATELIEKLKKLQKITHTSSTVEVFEGKEGLKTMYQTALKTKDKRMYSFGGTGKSYEVLKYEFPHIVKQAIKQKLRMKLIVNYSAREKEFVKEKGIEARYAPEGLDNNATTSIFGEYISIHILTEKPLIILIKNKEMAKGYRNYFELMWKASAQID